MNTLLGKTGQAAPAGLPTDSGGATAGPRTPLLALPWLLVGTALVGGLWLTGTPPAHIAGYGLYWALGIVVPGTVLHRALRGSRGNLPEDLAFGAVVGLVVELAAWALVAATGTQPLLRWWPAVVVALFLAVPGLRRHWRVTDPRPLPRRWAWAMASVLVLMIGWATAHWGRNPLPPVTFAYYQDLMYHLGLIQELTRTMPFEVPQLSGEALRYHYLGNAHMASASMVTGIPPTTVLLRLWIAPVLLTTAVVTAALARDVTGRWWTGPLTAGVAYVGLPLALGSPVFANGGSPVSFASPSQTYVLPFLVTLAGLCCDVVRGRPLRAAWWLVPALAVVCAGAKASALPPLLAGLLLVCAVTGWRRRRVPWAVVLAAGVLMAAMAVGLKLFAGGGAGTLGVQVLSLLRHMSPYQQTLGRHDGVQPGGLLPPGLAGADPAGWLFVLVVVGWWVLMQAPRLVGLLVLAAPKPRADPAAWLLAGTAVAGTAAGWLLYHPSASQVYFMLGAAPFAVILSGWLLAETAHGWRLPAAAFVLGSGVVLALPRRSYSGNTYRGWAWELAVPVGYAVAIGVAATLLAVLARRLLRGPGGRYGRAPALGAGLAALFGASVAVGVAAVAPGVVRSVAGRPAGPSAVTAVTADQMRAALWLDAHAADDDVVATNVHCRPVATTGRCDARAFWVTGLGGHRTVLEGWGYTDRAVAAHGRDGLPYPRQPAPEPERYALNERVFTAPTPADIETLRRQYGVRWLFADTLAGAVSPRLAGYGHLRHVSGSVTIYELPG